ncbi:MAG: zf-HC2 domain-containing protein [Candidatus Baltobacteraceae bacterium]
MNETHPTLEQIVDYLHGELTAGDDAAVHAHLAGCPSCSQTHQAEVSLTDVLRAHAGAQERELPASVIAGIREAIERKPTVVSILTRLSEGFRPIVLLPAAAALGIALYVGVNVFHGRSATHAINAAYYLENHSALAATTPFSQDSDISPTLASETSGGP